MVGRTRPSHHHLPAGAPLHTDSQSLMAELWCSSLMGISWLSVWKLAYVKGGKVATPINSFHLSTSKNLLLSSQQDPQLPSAGPPAWPRALTSHSPSDGMEVCTAARCPCAGCCAGEHPVSSTAGGTARHFCSCEARDSLKTCSKTLVLIKQEVCIKGAGLPLCLWH